MTADMDRRQLNAQRQADRQWAELLKLPLLFVKGLAVWSAHSPVSSGASYICFARPDEVALGCASVNFGMDAFPSGN
jgi:hypothetical protein